MEAGGLRPNDEGLMESDIPLGRPHYDLPTLNLDLMEESETDQYNNVSHATEPAAIAAIRMHIAETVLKAALGPCALTVALLFRHYS